MGDLTLDRRWLLEGFEPSNLYEGPFLDLPATPAFPEIADASESRFFDIAPTTSSLQLFAHDLVEVLMSQVDELEEAGDPIHCLLSGGYDSRLLAALLEERSLDVVYVMDGTQEPSATATLDWLAVPPLRRYVHDRSGHDPYGLVHARCDGFAPIFSQLDFFPRGDRSKTTLVAGLGGGEWFSYPAANWHGGKRPRTPREDLVQLWLDCWPQYALLPKAWGRHYKRAVYPYCTVAYAQVANRCRREWLHEDTGYPTLDAVREAMLDVVDMRLKELGWQPHRYDFRLTLGERAQIDEAFRQSWLFQRELKSFAFGRRTPADMTRDDYACTMGGFAQWCDDLIAAGNTITIA